MASNPVRLKLLQMLKSSDHSKFEESKQWLTELKHWTQCPTLQLYIVTGTTVAWLVNQRNQRNRMTLLQSEQLN